jgi:3-deoxy-D-manno-octulosonate 8-phosphate phosphatase (KDO 8-P phosphatase)
MSSSDKMKDFNDFLAKTQLSLDEIMYVGDDIPDYEIMSIVGLPVAPADAVPEIKQIARYISPRKGGEGVARDVIEQTLKACGMWMTGDAFGFGW